MKLECVFCPVYLSFLGSPHLCYERGENILAMVVVVMMVIHDVVAYGKE